VERELLDAEEVVAAGVDAESPAIGHVDILPLKSGGLLKLDPVGAGAIPVGGGTGCPSEVRSWWYTDVLSVFTVELAATDAVAGSADVAAEVAGGEVDGRTVVVVVVADPLVFGALGGGGEPKRSGHCR